MQSRYHYQQQKFKKVVGLMKGELVGRTMTEFTRLTPKAYSYLIDDGNSDKMCKKNEYSNLMIMKTDC